MKILPVITSAAAIGLALIAPIASGQDAVKTAVAPPRASPGESVTAPQPLFIVQLATGPGWDKSKPAHEQVGFKEHSQNLSRLRLDGMLVAGARYRDSVADKDMLIIRAENAGAVSAQFAADPMVKGKRFLLDIAAFQPTYDGFIASPARIAPDVAGAESPLGALAWLAGCWFGRNGKVEFREHWMRPAGDLMVGMGRTIAEGKVLSYEAMRIEADAAGIPVFVAKPSDQPEARFKSVKFEATSIVFENPDHDFPQRVKYQLTAEGTLDARIEGTLKGREARIEFPMRRTGCE